MRVPWTSSDFMGRSRRPLSSIRGTALLAIIARKIARLKPSMSLHKEEPWFRLRGKEVDREEQSLPFDLFEIHRKASRGISHRLPFVHLAPDL